MASTGDVGDPVGGEPRLALVSWSLYDWANSAFPTIIITFVFAAYFTKAVAESPVLGTAQWGWAISLAGLFIALLSPVLGAIADQTGRRKPWLSTFTVLCIVATAMLWFVRPSPDYVLWALVFVGLATVAFDFAMVFYNAMLPALAPHDRLGRWSGWGWAAGYAGGLACLVVALICFVQAEAPWFGLEKETAEHVRVTTLLVAVWFAVFSLPLFLFTPDRKATGVSFATAVRDGIKTLVGSLRNIRRYRVIARFLIARMIYTDGLNTLFIFGGVYAVGTFAMSVAEVIRFGIALNITAGLGAAAFAWVDDRIGPVRTILIGLAALILLGGVLLTIESKDLFWTIGLALGVFVGPVQAASRSMMARLAPVELQTEMFGLYALSGKVTAFLGPFLVGWVTLLFDSQRLGMATIFVFFALGLLILFPLRRVPMGRQASS
ncbi:MAG: MFS transporter [Alphaproteobacteria bacterium]